MKSSWMRKQIGFTLLWMMSASITCAASDAELEKRWGEALKSPQTKGEVLAIGTPPFAALLQEDSTGKSLGAILLLHDAGQHPDWPFLIRSLRLEFSRVGWNVLTIQLPVQDANLPIDNYAGLLEEATPRIQAAIKTLHDKKLAPIFVVGHGLGAVMGAMYFAQHPTDAQGFVGIGMLGLPGMEGKLNCATYLEKLKLPILDIYGFMDQDNVVQSARNRSIAARKIAGRNFDTPTDKDLITYRQMEIQGANHDFSGLELTLAKHIRGWLAQQTKLTEGMK